MQETEVRDWRYQLWGEDQFSTKKNISTKLGPVRCKPKRAHKKVGVNPRWCPNPYAAAQGTGKLASLPGRTSI